MPKRKAILTIEDDVAHPPHCRGDEEILVHVRSNIVRLQHELSVLVAELFYNSFDELPRSNGLESGHEELALSNIHISLTTSPQ
jgi:hypothetical protein